MEQEKNLEQKIAEDAAVEHSHTDNSSVCGNVVNYLKGCVNPDNARLYGNFQERAALNITQFPKIQGSLLIRMGLVYPIASAIVEKLGIPQDAHSDIMGLGVNYHTWAAGYLAYLAEIQGGLSKYTIEGVSNGTKRAVKGVKKLKEYLINKH